MARVITTAITTPAKSHVLKTHGGRSPKRRFLNVPPERDAMAAINAMPP
jgi:hypothetical protein